MSVSMEAKVAIPTQFQNEIGNGAWESSAGETSLFTGSETIATTPA